MDGMPDEDSLIERMAPGVLSRDGFHCADRRQLDAILQADAAAERASALTHEAIGRRLEQILQAAVAALGRPVEVAGALTACYHESMGRIPCPWGECGLFAKGEVELTDTRNNKTVRFTPLSVHMIYRHGFYQGPGSRYRIEPTEIVELLDIKPDEG